MKSKRRKSSRKRKGKLRYEAFFKKPRKSQYEQPLSSTYREPYCIGFQGEVCMNPEFEELEF